MRARTARTGFSTRTVVALVAAVLCASAAGSVPSTPAADAAKREQSCRASASHDPDVPRWARHRRATVLVDSVLLGSMPGIRRALRCWRVSQYGRPALMLRAAEQELRNRRVAPLVVVGVGYNSLWERHRARYGYWSKRFRGEATRLIRTLRRNGAEQIVWVTLREPKPKYLTPSGRAELGKYSWYFPYVNEQLRRLDRKRDAMVLADWTTASDRTGMTYDSIHVTPVGANVMGRTVRAAIRREAARQTRARRDARRDKPTRPDEPPVPPTSPVPPVGPAAPAPR